LNNLGNRYSEVGKRQEAVAPTEQALKIYRELAQTNPVFLPNLAGALNNLGNRYSEVGKRQEAVAPTEEALKIYRELARTNPAFLSNLAMALNNLGVRYGQIGKQWEIDAAWENTIRSMDPPLAKAFLLIRRADVLPPNELNALDHLLASWPLIPDDAQWLQDYFHDVCRSRRKHDPALFDEEWRRRSGRELPPWLSMHKS
jgi:tetratricopeptide (TPR) repeat protein